MDYRILSLLQPSQAESVLRELEGRSFTDGKLTALGGARGAKNNRQLERPSFDPTPLDDVIFSALKQNHDFQSFAIPKRVLLPIFSRYEPGMEYGAHVDGGIMAAAGEPLRTDLAMTLFLSPPETYDGGELMLSLPSGEEEIKLPAGEAIVYSARHVHRVAPVTRGVRTAAVTWIQSAVRDEATRAVLYDLDLALEQLQHGGAAVGETALLLAKSYHNLLRISSEL